MPHAISKLIFASDSFKGSLSAERIGELLTAAAHRVFGQVECICLPMADGGEGTTHAIIRAVGGERVAVRVHDPLMRPRIAHYGVFQEKTAVSSGKDTSACIIEMAEASGLTLLSEEERNPLLTTSFGTGEMVMDALQRGIRHIYIAIGGSATCDGGIGCLQALGTVFRDENGILNALSGNDLSRIVSMDITPVKRLLEGTTITVLCDVMNPLCGPLGATRVFGPQKCSSRLATSGSQKEVLNTLETGMQHYRDLIQKHTGINADEIKGTGAAGGLGAALILLLGGHRESGIETVLRLTDFDRHLPGTSLVITGEGKIDSQSSFGKVVFGVASHCQRAGIPVAAIVGQKGDGADTLLSHGLSTIITTADPSADLAYNLTHAEERYSLIAERFFYSLLH